MMRQVYAHRRAPGPWQLPGGLVGVATDPMTGQPALAPDCPAQTGKLEYFIAGTEPAGACVAIPSSVPVRADSVLPDSTAADSIPLDSLGADSSAP